MAGLDTRGLADGFAQGFGMMEAYDQRKINNERADNQEARQAKQDGRIDQQWDQQQDDRSKNEALEKLSMFYQQEASGMTPEWTADLDSAADIHPYLRLGSVYDPGTAKSVDIAKQVALGDMDPNSPEALEAFNQFYKVDIDKGDAKDLQEGETVRKSIIQTYPGSVEGTLSFELGVEVLDAQGAVVRSYTAPMTTGNSAGDDEVKQVSIEKMVNGAAGMASLQRVIPEEVKARRRKFLTEIGVLKPAAEQFESVQGPGGSVLQRSTLTGEMSQVVGRESSYGRSAFAPGALQKKMEYLKSEFPGESNQQIYERAINNSAEEGGLTIEAGRKASSIESMIERELDRYNSASREDRPAIQEEISRLEGILNEIVFGPAPPTPEQPRPGMNIPAVQNAVGAGMSMEGRGPLPVNPAQQPQQRQQAAPQQSAPQQAAPQSKPQMTDEQFRKYLGF